MARKTGPTKAQFIRVAKKVDLDDRIRIEVRSGKARWTNQQILVFDDPILKDIKSGKYTVYGKTIIPASKGFPKLDGVIPDRRRYQRADLVRFNGSYQIWRDEVRDMVPLQTKLHRVYVDWDYYDYLFRNFIRLGKIQWKVTHPQQPVLLYCNGEMVAAVMPVKMER